MSDLPSESSLQSSEDYVEFGKKLLEAKQILGNEAFISWLRTEAPWAEQYAEKLLTIAQLANGGGIFVSGDELNKGIGRAAMYLFAAPSTPLSARETAVQMIKQGKRVTVKTMKALIAGQSIGETSIATEAELEQLVCDWLEGEEIEYQRQVRCAVGRADIVTESAIFELKHPIDAESFFQAIGQVLLYRACINPAARAILVFVNPQTGIFNSFFEAAKAIGVEVLLW